MLDKTEMREFWKTRSEAWDRWADTVAETAERMNRPIIEAAGIAPGQDVLDLASGAGQPAFELARRVAPDGTVTATDLVPEMLAAAKRRAGDMAIPNIGFRVADMERLPFPDGSFDRVTCRFGIMFCPDPVAAAGEARRVLRPGGRAAFQVWGPREDTLMFDVILSAADEVLGPDPEQDLGMIFAYGEPGTMAAVLEKAGFVDVEEREHRLSGRADPETPFWAPQLDMSLANRLVGIAPERRAALESAIAERFRARAENGEVRLYAHVRVAVGRAPEA